MSRIIINGDDFGMNERCSRAIAAAFRAGAITDTTVMANGSFFEQAVQLAFAEGFADCIGIHFNLTEGAPLTRSIAALPDFVRDGQFVRGYEKHPRPLTPAEQEAVYAELSAQAERIRQAGIALTHADSHHYIHNIDHLSPIVAQVCREFGIQKIRLQRNIGEDAGRVQNNRFWHEQGFVTADYFCRMSDVLPEGEADVVEIMVHPDFDRSGALIDRIGMESGYPVGRELEPLSRRFGSPLLRYRDL